MTSFRLGIVVTHPIQYQAPLYRYLAAHTAVYPHVFYLTDHGTRPSYDPGFGLSIQYDVPLLEGYDYEFVLNLSPHPSPSTRIGAINPGLPRAIRGARVDALLVHGWSTLSAWLAFGTATLSRLPYLLRAECHPDSGLVSPGRRVLRHGLLRPLVRGAAACLAIGSLNRSFYLEYGAPPARIFDAPYSVDTERFVKGGERGRARRAELLEGLGLDPARPLVLFAAKLQPWKRPLDVVAALDRMGGAASLIIIGDGPLRVKLEALAEARPWMATLGFVNQERIAEWYGAAEVFVLPSEHEPWGLAVNEAMAAGATPVVSEAVGCGPDLVTPEVGWTHPVGDVVALADAIAEAARTAGDMSRRAATRAHAERWGIGVTAAGIEAAVRAVVSR